MMRGSWRDRDADTRLLNSSLPLTSSEHLAVQIAKHVSFFSVPSVYMAPAQLCLHSQLPRASLAPWSSHQPLQPLPASAATSAASAATCMPVVLQSPRVCGNLRGEKQGTVHKFNFQLNQTLSSPTPLVTTTREPLGHRPWVAS